MSKKFQYFERDEDKEFNISEMKKYVNTKQEIDKVLEKIITPIIQNKKLKILDACCGIGHITNLLSEVNSESKILGIDQTEYLIKSAKKLFKDKKNLMFEVGDIYDIKQKNKKEFDVSVSWKTISWLPHYEQMLKDLIDMTKNHIFLSSLFYDGDIDFEIKIREFKKESGGNNFNRYYNVYSLPQFKKFIYSLGIKNVKVYDFDIGIDLEKPPIDVMGTYTEKLDSGKRIQISGAVVMSWKIIRIDI
jgi:ubiquinone/menaquinone biosynthesis C-methylase UbiE